MSSATIKGRLPEARTILGVLDQQGQQAIKAASKVLVEETHQQAPRSSRGGQHLEDQFATRVSKTKTGWQAKSDFGRKDHRGVTAAQVARWVTRGTGLYRVGPGPKRKIRAKNRLKRMNLGGGVVKYSVRGQHPNPFLQRARDLARDRAERAIRHGATEAARILREKGIH